MARPTAHRPAPPLGPRRCRGHVGTPHEKKERRSAAAFGTSTLRCLRVCTRASRSNRDLTPFSLASVFLKGGDQRRIPEVHRDKDGPVRREAQYHGTGQFATAVEYRSGPAPGAPCGIAP